MNEVKQANNDDAINYTLLSRLVEECGELIQSAMKIMRFGIKSCYPDGTTNLQELTKEAADVLVCIEDMQFDPVDIEVGKATKRHRLQHFSKYEVPLIEKGRQP